MSSKRVRITPKAESDIDAEVIYLAEEANAEAAIRFFEAAHNSFRSILDMPGIGTNRETNNPSLVGIRQWTVSGFENYLIFYQAEPSGIVIVRVLHGARNIERILDEET